MCILEVFTMLRAKNPVKQGLNIIIVGCGKVGTTLIERLRQEGHDITIIDQDSKKVQEIASFYDVMGLAGNGASYVTQMDAGINTTDLLIAVTESDELNLLCCTVATQVANCAAIARVRTPDYSREAGYLRDKLGLAMIINPELEAAKEIARILYLPTALEVNSFAHGHAELIKIKIPENNILAGINVAMLSEKVKTNVLICAIERDGQVYIPSGESLLLPGDHISFVAPKGKGRFFLEDIGFKTNQVKSTMIIGGSRSAYYLATQLLAVGVSVKIIENNLQRCETLSEQLPKAIIIHGDGTDEDLLKEEGIESVESFVPLTGIDEENILLTLHAKQISHAKVITKINRVNFKDVISRLDLGSVVYPRFITAEAIIAYVRAKKDSMGSNIETLYHLFDSRAEAIEFRVNEESAVTNTPLMELSLKDDLLISFISRNGTILIPTGQDSIQVGDSVMVVTTHTGFNDLQDILK
jgi:trk system potassium uptake protein TrkA